MKKLLVVTVLMLGSVFCMNGCVFTYMAYNKAKKELCQERILASGDKDAEKALAMGIPETQIIKAVRMNGGGAGIGISIQPGMWDILSKNPGTQVGAAVLDAASIYALAELVKSGGSNTTSNDNSTTNNTTNNTTNTTEGDNSPIIDGDDNDTNNTNSNS